MTNRQEFAERMKTIIDTASKDNLKETIYEIWKAAAEFGCEEELRNLSWNKKTLREAIAHFEGDWDPLNMPIELIGDGKDGEAIIKMTLNQWHASLEALKKNYQDGLRILVRILENVTVITNKSHEDDRDEEKHL